MDTHFRIGFAIETKYSKSIKFSFESIDFGDPCVGDDTIYNTCTNHGTCVRNVEDGKLSHKCDCEPDYLGVACQALNYCKFKHEVSHRHNLTQLD